MSVATALLLSRDADLVATVHRAADSIPDFRLTVVECSIDLVETAIREDATLLIVHLTAQSDESELIALLHKSARSSTPLATLVISDKYNPQQELEALQAGASGYSARPIDPKKLATLVDVLTVRDRFQSNSSVSDPDDAQSSDQGLEAACKPLHDSFLYSSPLMTRMMSQIVKVAASDTGILLTGETGTGKTHLARWIHGMSPRRQRPFLTVNCASLSTSLIESELFGHVKGAFTGADQRRSGKLAEALDGTLLLDEIDALPYDSQGKLLQTVDEKIFVEVGSNRPQHIQARLIAATNRSLSEEVAAGRFRADLHFRLNVIEFKLPPLRERRSEIRIFAHQFVKQCAHRLEREVPHIELKALKLLELYPWPGNIRELRNAIERGVTLCTNNSITIDDLPETLLKRYTTINGASDLQAHDSTDSSRTMEIREITNSSYRSSEIPPVSDKFYSQSMLPEGISKLATVRLQAEVDCILEVLERQNNNRQQTARELGISRVALYKKLHKYGLIETR